MSEQRRTSLSGSTFDSVQIAKTIVEGFTECDYREEVEKKFLDRTGKEFMAVFPIDPETAPLELSD